MTPRPYRRRAFAIAAVGLVFLTLGLGARAHHGAYVALAACFFVIALATLRRRPGP